ncbi:MAG: hypothetical protein ISS19_15430 [Bacteroidales bacterium]|nr:hypothetical protein [Bacteroidales bacterium]
MSKKLLFFVCILFLITSHLKCQNWIRIYEGYTDIHAQDVLEHYDKGYIITGKQWDGNNIFGWIMKTDINGYERWSKRYGTIGKTNGYSSSCLTSDGGIVCLGSSNNINQSSTDPFIIKINACGEKEWCKIYNSPYWNSGGKAIVTIPGGGYMILIHNWFSGPEVWLFRLDSIGEIIWTKEYVTDQSVFWSPHGQRLLETTDSCFLITGHAYTPDSLTPGTSLLKVFLVKVNLDGEALFELPWGMNNGMVSEGHQTVEDTKHKFYTAGRRVGTAPPTLDMPSLFITSSDGYPSEFSDLRSTGLATTINWLQGFNIGNRCGFSGL